MKSFNLIKYFFIATLWFGTSIVSNSLKAQPSLTLDPVITGLKNPMHISHAGDGSNRLFVSERSGIIKVFNGTTHSLLGIFIDISTQVRSDGEGGLLSITFHPDFGKIGNANRGYVYVHFVNKTSNPGDIVVKRLEVSDPTSNSPIILSELETIRIPHPTYNNHYGGEMHFGPDGFLYISTGDGGSGGDPNNNAQRTSPSVIGDKSYLLGKMLRIDVNQIAGGNNYAIPKSNAFNNEIFDYGLRNPFRWSFDSQTGDMWIGDVGQSSWEEIDFRPASTSSGVNYGWNCFEGHATYPGTAPNCATISNYEPAYDYDGQSVIGGVVYRGTNTSLSGYYIGMDYYSGNLQFIKRNSANNGWDTTIRPSGITGISDISEAENHEIYATRMSANTVYRFEINPLPVKLTKFEGLNTIEGNHLFWRTSSEESFKEFIIEFSNGTHIFSEIGTIPGESRGTITDYNFFHSGIWGQNSYYRLKMIDQNNKFEYSRIIEVKYERGNTNLTIRPNYITSDRIQLWNENNISKIELINVTGAIVYSKEIENKSVMQHIPISQLVNGIYLVRFTNDEKSWQEKIMIAN